MYLHQQHQREVGGRGPEAVRERGNGLLQPQALEPHQAPEGGLSPAGQGEQ